MEKTTQNHLKQLQEHCEANNMSKHTINNYKQIIKRYIDWYKKNTGKPIKETQYKEIEKYLAKGLKNLKKSSKNIHRACLRTFFIYIIDKPEVVKKLKTLKTPKNAVEYISPEEYQELLRVALEHKMMDGKLWLGIELGFKAGLRVSEICSIKVGDLNFVKNVIGIVGKGNKKRKVPMAGDLKEDLHDYTSGMKDEDELFPGVERKRFYYWFKKCLSKSEVSEVYSPHSLRHGFIMWLLSCDFRLDQIRVLTGHSSMQSLQDYIHTQLNQELVEKVRKES